MFARLFAETGLSLDRLRALVEVGAAGSIAKAAEGDPIRQSQYSRQIKELEDFFQAKLVERHGKGIRLTAGGKELARISRFFLLGLSNFQRGCRAEEQTFRIGCSATFASCFLLPALTEPGLTRAGPRYAIEIAEDPEIERRLHDLTLDFGVVTAATISRPLQVKELGKWRLRLWVPKVMCRDESEALRAIKDQQLPLVLPSKEFASLGLADFLFPEPQVSCGSFVEAKMVFGNGQMAALLPSFLTPESGGVPFLEVGLPVLEKAVFGFRFAWNPRLLRLNPHASHRRDSLMEALTRGMRDVSSASTRAPLRGPGRRPTSGRA